MLDTIFELRLPSRIKLDVPQRAGVLAVSLGYEVSSDLPIVRGGQVARDSVFFPFDVVEKIFEFVPKPTAPPSVTFDGVIYVTAIGTVAVHTTRVNVTKNHRCGLHFLRDIVSYHCVEHGTKFREVEQSVRLTAGPQQLRHRIDIVLQGFIIVECIVLDFCHELIDADFNKLVV